MLDYRTNRTTIRPIRFDWFLVRFRLISYAGQMLFRTVSIAGIYGYAKQWICCGTNRKSVHTGTHPMLTLVPEFEVSALWWSTGTVLELPQVILSRKWSPDRKRSPFGLQMIPIWIANDPRCRPQMISWKVEEWNGVYRGTQRQFSENYLLGRRFEI